jgi:hypothetical protein
MGQASMHHPRPCSGAACAGVVSCRACPACHTLCAREGGRPVCGMHCATPGPSSCRGRALSLRCVVLRKPARPCCLRAGLERAPHATSATLPAADRRNSATSRGNASRDGTNALFQCGLWRRQSYWRLGGSPLQSRDRTVSDRGVLVLQQAPSKALKTLPTLGCLRL